MSNKKQLLKIILIIGGIIGYLCLKYLPTEFSSLFFVIATLNSIVYLVESVKNKYGKVHIAMSLLAFLLFIGLLVHFTILYKYNALSVYQNYILVFTLVVFVLMFIIAGVNYFKKTKGRESIFMKALIMVIIICVIVVIVGIILKKYGVIQE